MLRAARMLLEVFGKDQYWRLGALVLAMIVSGLLQTAGIASVVPFLSVVANPQIVSENAYLARAYDALGFTSTQQFLVALGLLFLAVMIVSNACTALTNWATVRERWRIQHLVAVRLLERYLRAPYAFHLNQNSADLVKRLVEEVGRVVTDVFMPFSRIVARVIASAFIIALLIWTDPLLAIVVPSVVGGFYVMVYLVVRNRQHAYGKVALALKTARFQLASEVFGGIKDIKVLGREDYFLRGFSRASRRYSSTVARHEIVHVLPKFALDVAAYGGIVGVMLYLLSTRETLDQVIPMLALYAFGANRLIPGVQEVFWAAAQVRFNLATLEELHLDLMGQELYALGPAVRPSGAIPKTPLTLTRSITLDHLTFTYPGAGVPAVSDVSIEIPVRRTCAFVGSTGSGKTTLIDLLLGLYAASAGRILIDDVPLDVATLPGWRRIIGHVPQSIFLADTTVTRNIAFGIPDEEIDHDAVHAAARAAHLDGFVASLPNQYDTLVGERGVRLSGGQRQRIGIARALYHNPELVILDEATSALDTVTEDVVMQAIGEMAGTRTIVLIAHRLSTVRDAEIIFVLEQGRVVGQGTYDELVASNKVFRAMARA